MRSIASILVLLALPAAAWAQPLDPNRPPLGRGDLTRYAWNETTDLVRVPKGLLRYFDFDALDFSKNPEVPKWIVSDSFIGVFGLTPAEAQALTLIVNQTREAQRRAEGNHLRPVEGRLPMGTYRNPGGLTVLDERTFTLEPHQDALDQVERDLRAGLLRVLGRQRADEFWRRSRFQWSLHPSTTGSESFTFRLIEIRSIRSIDLVRVSGGGSSGGPYFEEADEYAPESLKPILKNWRAAVREYQRTNSVSFAGKPSVGPVADSTTATVGAPDGRGDASSPAAIRLGGPPLAAWDEGAAYAEFSKNLIPTLGIPTIGDDEISPEAEVLFGLTSDEARAVSGLFNEFGLRFELLEASHFSRQNAGENRFVLSKFPDEAKSLCDEWLLRLKGTVGNRRGELLDLCMRETEAQFRRSLFDHRPGRQRFVAGWPVWLLRGKKAFQITANIQEGPDARFSLELRDLEDPDGLKASTGGPIRGFPKEFRHLFRLEGIEPTRKPGPTPF